MFDELFVNLKKFLAEDIRNIKLLMKSVETKLAKLL